MFQDLKEYQDLTRIYNESVNISEEQKEINKLFLEADFTAEEIQYLDENFDELWESELGALSEEYIIESYKEQNLTEEQLNEMQKKVIAFRIILHQFQIAQGRRVYLDTAE